MKRKLSFLAILILGACMAAYAQDYIRIADSMKGAKFSEIILEIEKQWEDKDKGKGSGYKQFKRWEHFNSSRLTPDGYLRNTANSRWKGYYSDEEKSAYLKNNSSSNGNWNSLGASKLELFYQNTGGIGRVNCIAVDPSNSDIIYVGTPGGGLWRTSDAGGSWDPITDGMPRLGISGIAIDPSSPENNRTIYILTGDGDGNDTPSLGVYKSIDNGELWNSTSLTFDASNIVRAYKLIMHPSNYNMLFAATGNGLYQISNGGLNNVKVADGFFTDIEFRPGSSDIMYASTIDGKVFKSTDTGSNWTQITSGLPANATSSRVALGVTEANPDYVYALFGKVVSAGTFTGMYLSTDGGNTFTKQSDTPNILGDGNAVYDQSTYDLAIAISPINENEVHVGGINAWKSEDAGVTWTCTGFWTTPNQHNANYLHADIHSFDFVGNTLFCGNDGGIYISTDNAGSWTDLSDGLDITQYYRIGANAGDPGKILAGAQDNGSNRIEDSTKIQFDGADGMECFYDHRNPNIIYGSWQSGNLFVSNSNGQGKTDISAADFRSAWLTPFIIDPYYSGVVYTAAVDVYKSTTKGLSWTKLSDGDIGYGYCDFLAVAPSNTDFIYTSKYDRLYKTSDGGDSWNQLTNLTTNAKITYFVIHPHDENTLWLTAGMEVYKTIDGGDTWTDISNNLPDQYANCITYQKGSNDRVYVGMDVGVYYLDNSSPNWVEFSTGLVNVEIYELEINYVNNKIRAATYGRGVWESDLYINCEDPTVVKAPQPNVQSSALKSAARPAANTEPIIVEAETFTNTNGTYNDGHVPYGVNNSGIGINYVNTGDWAEYAIEVIDAGEYQMEYAISSPSDNAQVQFAIDGTTISEDNVTNNGEWDNYYSLLAADHATLTSGSHTVRITASGTNAWQWNLEKFTLNPVGGGDIAVTGVTFQDRLSQSRLGSTFQLIPVVSPEDATDKSVRYESDDTSIITVSETGLLTAVELGNTNVRVITNDGNFSDELAVTVFGTAVTGVTLSDNDIVMNTIETHQLTATVLPTDATIQSVTWSSSNTNVATVDASGLVTAIADGTATITVKTDHRGYEASCTVSIGQVIDVTGISFSQTEISLFEGDSFQLTPDIQPTNATDKSVTWSSGDEAIATVDNNGNVSAIAEGLTSITATTTSGGYSASVNVDVDRVITNDSTIIEAENFVDHGGTYNDSYVPYGVNKSVVGINYVNGGDWVEYNVNVPNAGTYQVIYYISTPLDGGAIELQLNDVTISNDNVPNNGDWDSYVPLEASSNIELTSGDNLVKIVAGTKDWQWNLDKIVFKQINIGDVPVTGVTLTESAITVKKENTHTLTANVLPGNATDQSVTWSSANDLIASVDNQGIVTGVSVGSATVTVTTNDGGFTADCQVTVDPPSVTGVELSETSITFEQSNYFQLTETVLPTDAGDKSVSWSSADESVATVSTSGNVYGVAVGTTTITATTNDGGYTANCQVTVEPSAYSFVIQAELGFMSFSGAHDVNGTTATKAEAVDNAMHQFPTYYQDGTYVLEYVLSNTSNGLTLEFRRDYDNSSISILEVPNTGDENTFITVVAQDTFSLIRGTHYSGMFHIDGTVGSYCYIDKYRFRRVGDVDYSVTGISLTDSVLILNKGEIDNTTVTFEPFYATNTDVVWSSNSEGVATVSEYGYITAIAEGEAIITATSVDGGHVKTCKVYVISPDNSYTKAAKDFNSGNFDSVLVINSQVAQAEVGDESVYNFEPIVSGQYNIGCFVATNLNNLSIEVYRDNDINPVSVLTVPNTKSTSSFKPIISNAPFEIDNAVHSNITLKITGTDGDFCNIDSIVLIRTTNIIPVESVAISNENMWLVPQQDSILTAHVLPLNATYQTITWNSSDESIVTVGLNGELYARALGTAIITVTSNDGGFTANCTVKVAFPKDQYVIEAEEFVLTGGAFDGFQTYTVGSIGAINYNQKGDWADYKVDIEEAGKYEIEYFISTPMNTAGIEFIVNNTSLLTDAVPNNGGWDDFVSLKASKYVEFEIGTYDIRLISAGTVTAGWEWNLDRFELKKVGEICDYEYIPFKAASTNELSGFYDGPMEGLIEKVEGDNAEFISQPTNELSIYPNPTSSQFTISFNIESSEPSTIQIRNILGELQAVVVDGEILEEGKYEINYNVENLVSGMYLVTFSNGITNEVKTLVVE